MNSSKNNGIIFRNIDDTGMEIYGLLRKKERKKMSMGMINLFQQFTTFHYEL